MRQIRVAQVPETVMSVSDREQELISGLYEMAEERSLEELTHELQEPLFAWLETRVKEFQERMNTPPEYPGPIPSPSKRDLKKSKVRKAMVEGLLVPLADNTADPEWWTECLETISDEDDPRYDPEVDDLYLGNPENRHLVDEVKEELIARLRELL